MEKVLSVKDLCKTYITAKRQNHVLKNICFDVYQGEFISVMGPSGSGKSTMLYCVSGMDRATAGQILFCGQDIAKLNERKAADMRLKQMGFVFQQMYLLKNLNLMDNIVLPGYMVKNLSRQEVRQYAQTLMQKAGIESLSIRKVTEASGGELQRVAICRALINSPKMLFADEPTGALNQSSAQEVMELFRSLNLQGATILLVTHDSKIAARSQKIMYMQDGVIQDYFEPGTWDGSESELKKREIKLNAWLLDRGW